MIEFELNVAEKRMIIHGDKSNPMDSYYMHSEPTVWCINYLKQYIYRSIKNLVNGRKQAYAHVVYVDGVGDCDHLLQKNEFVYNTADWLNGYLKLLQMDLMDIMPKGNSRYLKNFCQTRDELIQTLRHYRESKPMYRKSNLSIQTRMNLV